MARPRTATIVVRKSVECARIRRLPNKEWNNALAANLVVADVTKRDEMGVCRAACW